MKWKNFGHREISAHGEHDVVPTGDVEQRITLPDQLLHPLPHVVIVQLLVVLHVKSSWCCLAQEAISQGFMNLLDVRRVSSAAEQS